MLVDKEVIRPGTYWYRDETTGEPRKLTVTPELTRYWHDQGNKMLSAGLTVPVPCEHDFNAHPMTPADKLKNNAGWVDGYEMRGDALFSRVRVEDPDIAKKLPTTIKWTSPWINSFTDGDGREWKNVISHLALTTRPRIINQQSFGSVAAALSMAHPIKGWGEAGAKGLYLSRAGLLDAAGLPKYPVAFSLMSGASLATDASGHEHDASGKFGSSGKSVGVKSLAKKSKGDWVHHPKTHRRGQVSHVYNDNENHRGRLIEVDYGKHKTNHREHDIEHSDDQSSKWVDKPHEINPHTGKPFAIDAPPQKQFSKKNKPESQGGAPDDNPTPGEDIDLDDDDELDDDEPDLDDEDALLDQPGDVGMEELLCDLLGALGIQVEHTGGEDQFKRSLYNAAMTKIHELAGKGDANKQQQPNRTNPPGQPPNNPKPQPGQQQQNPLIQQEQQPMFMSLEDINKIADPTMKSVALAMHAENQKLRADLDSSSKTANSLRDAKLKEAAQARDTRVAMITRFMPRVKPDLDAMLALPAMALSMGEGGAVVDPMAQTLAVLEKGLADLPKLLTTDASALSVHPQPADDSVMSEQKSDDIADLLARQMGCPPAKKVS